MTSTNQRSDVQTYLRLISYIRGKVWFLVIAILVFCFASLSEVFFAQVLGTVVDVFDPPTQDQANQALNPEWYWLPDLFLHHLRWPKAIAFAVMIGMAALVRALSTIVGEFLLSRVSFLVVHAIRCELHARLLVLPCSYFDSARQGDLSNRLTDTTSKLRDTATDVLRILMQDGGKLVFMLATMLLINWQLTCLFLMLAPVVGLVVHHASLRFRRISRNIQTSMGEVTHIGQESAMMHKAIRSYNAQDQQAAAFEKASEQNRRQHLKLIATKAISAQFIQFLVAIAIAILVGILFLEEISQGMSPGHLVTYIGLAGALASPIKRLSDVNARIQIGLAAATEIFDQIDLEKEQDEGSESLVIDQGRVVYQDVGLVYTEGGRQVLSNVSLEIEEGQTVALVGSTGAGKTSLIHLLLGYYEPTHGEISIDSKPLSSFTKSSLRHNIAFVSQDVLLFNTSIRGNVAYGSLRDASEVAIQDAIRRARVDLIVDRFPEGLDTVVGDRGSKLSHGERQRILIARAILKDAPILILDEATSSLDNESERLIQAALNEMMVGRTTLVVAHRLTTIENADMIAVMEQGQIVERGKHSELLAHGGKYALFHQSQFREAG